MHAQNRRKKNRVALADSWKERALDVDGEDKLLQELGNHL